MIDSISGSGMQISGMQQSMGKQEVPLTEEQKDDLLEILSNYDPTKMTEDDKKSLMDELKSSGIAPSREVRSLIEDAGFELGKPPGGPPPPGGSGGMPPSKPDFVQDAIEKYESGEFTEDDIADLLTQLKKTGEPTQGILVDQKS